MFARLHCRSPAFIRHHYEYSRVVVTSSYVRLDYSSYSHECKSLLDFREGAIRNALVTRHSLPLAHGFRRQQLSFSPTSDDLYTTRRQDQDTGKLADKSEGTGSTLINPKQDDLSSPSGISESAFPYGIDWRNRAYFASHCWLPSLSNESATSQLSAYVSCANSQSPASSLVQCASCSLILHADDLTDLQATSNAHNLIPLCRPSFTNSNMTDNSSLYQRHHCWRVPNCPASFRAEMPRYLQSMAPIIFLISKLSGGQQGEQIYRQLVRLFNPDQVFLLDNDATIDQALKTYRPPANTRICICGGDGTVGWVLSRLVDSFPPLQNPPASICPLGTGNDLSRILGWGYQYDRKRFLRTLSQISEAKPIALDRWRVQVETMETITTASNQDTPRRRFFSLRNHPKFIRDADQPLYDNHRTQLKMHFFSYMSFGLDAAVVLDFHVRRTRDPSKFTSPFKNKFLYVNESRKYFKEFVFGRAWNLSSYIRLICDGKDLTDSIRSCHTLVLLNTPGFGSGTQPWGRMSTSNMTLPSIIEKDNDSFDKNDVVPTMSSVVTAHNAIDQYEMQNFADRKLEVLGLNAKQMVLIHIGFRGDRIAQCRQVRIELKHPMPVHMDGEPFYLPGSAAVNITHAGQVVVLRNENR